MANELTTVNERALSLRGFLHSDRIKDQLQMAMPKWLSVDRLLRIVFSSAIKNPRLLECSQESILQSVMMCAQLGLEPILGRAYLIPYNNSKQIDGRWTKVMECQFQPGYQGLVDLARRSGTIKDVYGSVVYENDEFDYNLGTERRIHHKPTFADNPGKMIGAYVVWDLDGNLQHPEFMPMREIYKRREKSQAWQYAKSNPNNKTAQDCPWIQWPDEMALKTVVKHSSKLVPASIEFMEAVAIDDASDTGKRYVSPFMDAMNQIPEKTPADLSEEFDRLADQMVDSADRETFDLFVENVARNNGKSIQVAKADVMSADDFNGLLGAFNAQKAKLKPSAQDPAKQEGTGGPPTVDRNASPAGRYGGSNSRPRENTQQDGGGSQQGNGNGKQQSGPGQSSTAADVLDDLHPLKRERWFQRKGATLRSYVTNVADRIADMPMEDFEVLANKWQSIYDEKFPWDPDGNKISTASKPIGATDERKTSCEGDDMGAAEISSNSGGYSTVAAENDAPENEKTDPGASETVEDLMISAEWTQLTQLAAKYPQAYAAVKGDRARPANVADAKFWIGKIHEHVEFTGEEPQEGF